jgi:hypothetical protein
MERERDRYLGLAAVAVFVCSALACAVPGPPSPPSRTAPASAPGAASSAPSSQPTGADRLIVRTATLTVLVNDVPDAAAKTGELATALGGFVVSSNQREEGANPTAMVTIRVPAARLDEALARIKTLAVKVRNEQVTGQDVTEEFVDTDARLRNLRATETRYLELLQQAQSVTDVLGVEKELTNVRGQIEQLQARLQFLQRSVELATITIDVRAASGIALLLPDWNILPAVTNAWAALLNVLYGILVLVIWVAVFTPLWLPTLLLVRRWRRRSRSRVLVPPPEPTETPATS